MAKLVDKVYSESELGAVRIGTHTLRAVPARMAKRAEEEASTHSVGVDLSGGIGVGAKNSEKGQKK